MSASVTLCFALGTAGELYLLKWLGDQISILNTISLVMLTFLVGIVVGRSWGKQIFDKMQWHLKSRTLPADDVVNGAVMCLASMALITPGIVTDSIGLLILFPLTRGLFTSLALNLVKKKISSGQLYFFFRN